MGSPPSFISLVIQIQLSPEYLVDSVNGRLDLGSTVLLYTNRNTLTLRERNEDGLPSRLQGGPECRRMAARGGSTASGSFLYEVQETEHLSRCTGVEK
jgi:hypothetical protein